MEEIHLSTIQAISASLDYEKKTMGSFAFHEVEFYVLQCMVWLFEVPVDIRRHSRLTGVRAAARG